MNQRNTLIAVAVVGLLIGITASQFLPNESDGGYCETIEKEIRQNQSFNGSISCYPPTEEYNASNIVENTTDVRCVCRKVQGDQVSIFVIRQSR